MVQEKIEIIRDKFKNASIEKLPELMTTYREDGRIGVGKILERAQKKLDAYNKELDRVQKMLSYEKQYGECGVICGIDEAGRGPLAGPVVAAAVILDINCPILYVNDSKKLSEKKREELYDEIMERPMLVAWVVKMVETCGRLCLRKSMPRPDIHSWAWYTTLAVGFRHSFTTASTKRPAATENMEASS